MLNPDVVPCSTYSIVFHDEEPEERMAEWNVVHWTMVNTKTGARSGTAVYRSYDRTFGDEYCRQWAEKNNIALDK